MSVSLLVNINVEFLYHLENYGTHFAGLMDIQILYSEDI